MVMKGSPKHFVESDRARAAWLSAQQASFQSVRARGITNLDAHTTDSTAFWAFAESQSLVKAFHGYASSQVNPDLPMWKQQTTRVLQTVDYLNRRRNCRPSTSEPMPYAGLTAAVLLDLPILRPHPKQAIRVTSQVRRARRTKHTLTHTVTFTPHTIPFADFRVTSLEQTIIDLARLYGPEHGLVAADFALANYLTTSERLVRLFNSLPSCHGRRNARVMLDLMDGRRESVGESLMFFRFSEAGLPLPEPQLTFWIQGQQMRPDAVDTDRRYVFAFDGNAKLTAPSMTNGRDYRDLVQDATWKERLLADAGYKTFHLRWEDVRTTDGFRRWLNSRRSFGLAY